MIMLWIWLSVLVFCCIRGAKADEDLKPLKLPADYEEKMQTVLPELMKQAGIPTSILPFGNGIVASSLSTVSNGLGYLKFWGNRKNDDACKSELKDGKYELTKHGRMVCKRICSEKHKDKANFMKKALESIVEHSEEASIDVETEAKNKIYECANSGVGYDCVCLEQEMLKVSPRLRTLLWKILRGDKRRDVLPDHSLKKILTLIFLYMAEKMYHVAKVPFSVFLHILHHMVRKIE